MKKFLLLLLLLLVQACATKYQAYSLTGGYEETKISNNLYGVSYEVNGYSLPDSSIHFLLLRAAEIAIYNNKKFFEIIPEGEKRLFVGSGKDPIKRWAKVKILSKTKKISSSYIFNALKVCNVIMGEGYKGYKKKKLINKRVNCGKQLTIDKRDFIFDKMNNFPGYFIRSIGNNSRTDTIHPLY